ncbi:MAG: peptidoglycan DD-metalloendopeptidase family protein [Eubacteriaceae bacterium]|nr:peptidoglycan DD-metalloendopeptidase family protein [Eubacteriaceae bacterium]
MALKTKKHFREKEMKKKGLARRSAGIILAAFIVMGASCVARAQTKGYDVIVNGQSIGCVRNASVVEEAMADLNRTVQFVTGKDNAYIADEVVLKPVIDTGAKMDMTEVSDAFKSDGLNVKLKGAVINIDGQNVAHVASEEQANQILNDYKNQFATVEGASVKDCLFKEKVAVQEESTDLVKSGDYHQAMDTLQNGGSVVTQNTVSKDEAGDISQVAANNGMTVETLSKLNEDKDLSALNEGDVITTTQSKPALTVSTTVEKQYSEEIPFETEEQQDDSLTAGKEEIIQAGEKGSKDVDALITYENGQEVAKTIQSENQTKEPVKCVKKVGTQATATSSASDHPAISGSGQFIMPASGTIGDGGSHGQTTAIDIINGYGTPIYASAAGTVTMATNCDWGGYGCCVQIDHGNGYSTLYGHMSAVGVAEGQSVTQGQCIGEMGSTGDSTCNHCHFEIRYNGARQNVQNYLNF